MNLIKIAIFSILLIVLTGCSDPEVKWKNYSPMVKERIDTLISSKDCSGLQKEFDAADRNSDAQRARTREGNSNLMWYIDDQMRKLGCYA